MEIFFFFSMFFFTTLLFGGILSLVFRNQIIIEQRVMGLYRKRDNKNKENKIYGSNHNKKSLVKYIKLIINRSKKQINNNMSQQSSKALERRLRDAGYPFNWSPIEFRLAQIILAVTFFLIIMALFLPLTTDYGKLIILALFAGLLGAVYPNYYLQTKKKQRLWLIQKQMADFFDMVNLVMEAGMGLDQALSKVSKQNKGPLSDEFLRTLDDIKLGKSRREAFSELRNRVPLNQFQSIIGSIIQADQLGMGMAKVIHALTVRIRENQRELAREQAMKAPIKMMFPMVFFIFPSLFIVLLGPLVIFFITKGFSG